MPWAEGVVSKDGMITLVKCKLCSLIEKKGKIMGCKWDTLTKHQGCQIASQDMPSLGVKKGGEYIAKDYAHLKNMKLYAKRGSKFILVQVNTFKGKGIEKLLRRNVSFMSCIMVVPC